MLKQPRRKRTSVNCLIKQKFTTDAGQRVNMGMVTEMLPAGPASPAGSSDSHRMRAAKLNHLLKVAKIIAPPLIIGSRPL